MLDARLRPPVDPAEVKRRKDEWLDEQMQAKRRARHQAMREAETAERETFEAERTRRLDKMPKVDLDAVED